VVERVEVLAQVNAHGHACALFLDELERFTREIDVGSARIKFAVRKHHIAQTSSTHLTLVRFAKERGVVRVDVRINVGRIHHHPLLALGSMRFPVKAMVNPRVRDERPKRVLRNASRIAYKRTRLGFANWEIEVRIEVDPGFRTRS
jgi:hypothetical protein